MPGGRGTPVLRVCEVCEQEFLARPHARSCGDKCRKILSRRGTKMPSTDIAVIYALKEDNGNIYYVGSKLERAAPRGHVLPPGGEMIVLSRVPAETRYVKEQEMIDKMRSEGHNLVNKYNPVRSGKWK